MKVKEAMHKGVEWVGPDTPVIELAKLMRKYDIGAIPIGENDQLVGMVTDRDIVCKGLAKESDPAHVAHHLSWHLGRLGVDPADGPSLVEVVKAQRERCKTLVEMAERSLFLYREFDDYEEKAASKNLESAAAEPLAAVREQLSTLGVWEAEAIHAVEGDMSHPGRAAHLPTGLLRL